MSKIRIGLIALVLSASSYGQTIFNCTAFSSTGPCGVGLDGTSGHAFQFAQDPTGVLSGSNVNLIPLGTNGGSHTGAGFIYQTPVNVQAFTSTFTYVPNGKNIGFVVENNNSAGGNSSNPQYFAGGAGCEAGLYQAFTNQFPPINNMFGLELDQFSPLSNTAPYPYTLTYSSVQIYHASQSTCIPPYNGTYGTDFAPSKISTSPVPLNNPPGTGLTTTGHTYSVTITYDGSNFTLNLYDMTAGGSCPGANCFTNSWSGVNIPSLVGKNTAYVGLTGGTNSDAVADLIVKSFSYTQGAATPPPQPTLASIAVTPINLSIAVGVTQQYTAICTQSDGTVAACTVTWSSSDTTKAAISISGLASGVAAGGTVITATLGTVKGTSNLTVIPSPPTLSSIAVTPAGVSILAGATQQYTAMCTLSDSSVAACTAPAWTSSDTSKATVSASGLATGIAQGNTTIAAASGTIQGTAPLTVTASPTAPTMTHLTVGPVSATLLVGSTVQYVATCAWSDSTKTDCTANGKWASSNTSKATITAAGGLATGVSNGTTSISARVGNFQASTNLLVKSKTKKER